jgi:hypothetical protein
MSTGVRSESTDGPRPDGSHLDEDAECLEDPVHCGDARHQHDVHAATSRVAPEESMPAAADVTDATTGETSQA